MVIFCRININCFLFLCYPSVSHIVYHTNTAFFGLVLHSQLCVQQKILKHVKTTVLMYSILSLCSITESVYNFQTVQTKI